jgi:hypothetical protein
MILYKTPPPKKDSAQNKCFRGRAQLPARACACVQILTCMPAGDSNPTGNLLSSFSVGAQLQGNKHQTSAASDAKTKLTQRAEALRKRQEGSQSY